MLADRNVIVFLNEKRKDFKAWSIAYPRTWIISFDSNLQHVGNFRAKIANCSDWHDTTCQTFDTSAREVRLDNLSRGPSLSIERDAIRLMCQPLRVPFYFWFRPRTCRCCRSILFFNILHLLEKNEKGWRGMCRFLSRDNNVKSFSTSISVSCKESFDVTVILTKF